MQDSNIVARFDEIYNSTNRTVLTFITAKCGRTADVSDIFQETLRMILWLINFCWNPLRNILARSRQGPFHEWVKRKKQAVQDNKRTQGNIKMKGGIVMKGHEVIDYIVRTKMPDSEAVRRECISQDIRQPVRRTVCPVSWAWVGRQCANATRVYYFCNDYGRLLLWGHTFQYRGREYQARGNFRGRWRQVRGSTL